MLKIFVCLWAPSLLIILSIMNIIKPFKIKGALIIKASTKNENTWNFSQRFYAVFLLILSLIYLVVACVILQKVFVDELNLRIAGCYIGLIAPPVVLIPVPFTTLALKIRFDSEGNCKNNKI